MSVDVGGPHESSDGREDIISESDMGAMIAVGSGADYLFPRKVFNDF